MNKNLFRILGAIVVILTSSNLDAQTLTFGVNSSVKVLSVKILNR